MIKWLCHFTFPLAKLRVLFTLNPLQHLVASVFKTSSILIGIYLSHCGFNLYFSNYCDIEHFFMGILAILSFVGEMLIKSFVHFHFGNFFVLIVL